MKLVTYLGLLSIAVLLAAFAHADSPGYPQQQPQQQPQPPQYYPVPQENPCVQCQPPVANLPADQYIYSPPGAIAAPPPVLPYPGPQVRVMPLNQPLVGFCTLQPLGNGLVQIILNNSQALYQGVSANVQSVLIHYQRIGVCRQVF